ncbi:MAG: cytochrome-c oxidase, cbb3-type subunit III [Pseudomonadota bacterium]
MTQDHNKPQKDIDEISGVETTGHEWDGIKELNNPAPRWWLWVFFITCIWAIGYWVIYPAWPVFFGDNARGGTKGLYEWTQYSKLKDDQTEITNLRGEYLTRFRKSSFEDIAQDPVLYSFAIAGGKSAFKDNCATCHGTGGAGAKGYPNLNDDDWIWGGTVEDIHQTLLYGIRSTHEETRYSEMNSFKDMLTDDQINEVATFVYNASHGKATDEKGSMLFQENCAACHGADGRGLREIGAPNLMDQVWLYGGKSVHEIAGQIRVPKHGMMPHWEGRLDPQTIRQLAIYVHALGGGE